MNPTRQELRAWLELARVSNAPTVVSNVLAGVAISVAASGNPVAPRVAVWLCLGGLLLYTGGMMLNDVLDAGADRAERPARPIPSGRIGRSRALGVAVLLLAGGVASFIPAGGAPLLVGAALLAAIVVYDLIHRRTAASVVVMGLCRALLYLVAVAASVRAAEHPRTFVPVVLVGAYTAAFSFVARAEAASGPAMRRVFAWLPLPLGVVVVAVTAAGERALFALVPVPLLAAASIWAVMRPPRVQRAVLAWIASFSLIDAGVCGALGRLDLAGVCGVCFLTTAWLHRKIAGT